MKLLLTSTGITNKSLKKALNELVGEEIRTAFISTGANVVEGDKSWLVKNFQEFEELGYIDIIDIAVLPKEIYLKRISKANVIAMGGGDTSYLIKKVKESGFDKELPKLLETKTYVGISAGNQILSEYIWASSEFLYSCKKEQTPKGLNYIDFYLRPHYNSKFFPQAIKENLEIISKENPNEKIYACDDDSGLKIVNGNIEVVSEGICELFYNKK
jgi:dipeptidase E